MLRENDAGKTSVFPHPGLILFIIIDSFFIVIDDTRAVSVPS